MRFLSAICVCAVLGSGLVNLACYAAQSVTHVVYAPLVSMAELEKPQAKAAVAKPMGGDVIGELIQTNGWGKP